ncbi:hypothetical protein ACQJBY_039374 [Aegilops geniculata]
MPRPLGAPLDSGGARGAATARDAPATAMAAVAAFSAPLPLACADRHSGGGGQLRVLQPLAWRLAEPAPCAGIADARVFLHRWFCASLGAARLRHHARAAYSGERLPSRFSRKITAGFPRASARSFVGAVHVHSRRRAAALRPRKLLFAGLHPRRPGLDQVFSDAGLDPSSPSFPSPYCFHGAFPGLVLDWLLV